MIPMCRYASQATQKPIIFVSYFNYLVSLLVDQGVPEGTCSQVLRLTSLHFEVRLVLKASAHSFKQFTSRLLKLSFSLSMHLYNSDGRHAWFHLHGTSRPDGSASEATKYKMKNSLSTVGLEPSTLRFQVWCSTYWASRAWWMLAV